ncbi:hypothetical protein CLOM_g21763 [Closterium sp. NIES-68]|nr:hypothetical protein CLOM_g21763 [Closterium sp. NIES-68]GJP79851.1 hypothetical protein CLOP_g10054 [Closterium sp. NIES-67]
MAVSRATLAPRPSAYSLIELGPSGTRNFCPRNLSVAGAEVTLPGRAGRKGSWINRNYHTPSVRPNSGVWNQGRGRARVVAAAGTGAGESVKELKQQLLRAVGGTQRGKAASPQQRQQILRLIEQLEAANPTPSPMQSPLLAGTWALVYIAPTAASSNTLDASEEGPFLARVKPLALGGVRQKASLQIIHPEEGRAENVALFTAWGVDGELRIDAECKAPAEESKRGVRSTVRFLSFKLALGPLGFTLPLSLISPTGWIDVTYIDEEVRVTRGDKGSVFLATRVKA